MKTLFLVMALSALFPQASFILPGLSSVPDSGPSGFERSVLALSGASCMEELSAEEISRFERLARRPLDLNRCGRGALITSGLFSGYQAASLLEYRSRTGDIMSWSELALVDGFSVEFAGYLRPFVKIGGGSAPGPDVTRPAGLDGSAALSSDLSLKIPSPSSGGAPYGADCGGRLRLELESPCGAELYWTFSPEFTRKEYGPGTLSAAYYGKKRLSKLVLGHFNARFGQGLLQWSGFSLSGFSSIQAFCRNASGFSPTGSASASLCGAAVELDFGRFGTSAAYSFAENRLLASLSHHTRRTTAGLTFQLRPDGAARYGPGVAAVADLSADCRISLPGASVFAEAAYSPSGGAAFCAGMLFVPEYGYRYAFQLRWYPPASGERSLAAAGAQWPWGFASLEAGLKEGEELRGRALLTLKKDFMLHSWTLSPSFRYACKADCLVSVFSGLEQRHEFRLELDAAAGRFRLRPRLDYVISAGGLSWLGCAESGWDAERLRAFVKAGVFDIPDWDGRIYVYQRSVPGGFSVPAFRGRGFFVSWYLYLAVFRAHGLYITGSTVAYPYDSVSRDGKCSLCIMWKTKF